MLVRFDLILKQRQAGDEGYIVVKIWTLILLSPSQEVPFGHGRLPMRR